MARSFKLPDLGEGIHEGEVLAVHVSAGDEIKEGDLILEVETDKAAVEIPSPYTGRVEEILVKPGDMVNVGDVLMRFSDGEKAEPLQVRAPEEVAPAPQAPEPVKPRPAEPVGAVKAAPPHRPSEPAPVPSAAPVREDRPVPASPATRRLARELGVDLGRVPPTGPGGLVTADDVRTFAQERERAAEAPSAPEVAPKITEKPSEGRPILITVPPLPDFEKWGPVERVPVRSIRRATARQMALSWSQIPHVHNLEWIDMSKLEAFRKNHKAKIEAKGGKLTVTVFALKAVAAALKAHPRFNAALDSDAGELILKHYYHIGVAVATDDGLLVPVVRDVDRKSIEELSIELNDLVQRTRDRKASLEELQGGTFTITNVGPMGGGHFAPLINYPEVAILGLGSARMQPVVVEKGQERYDIVPRLMMPIVLCFDHRVLDGADGLAFIRILIESLEDPEQLLMKMT
jgi:pyruvate dehydrogenase E2 component (dihydrolipoamide acetyltransferase)